MPKDVKSCGNCVAWGANDAEVARAPCLRLPGPKPAGEDPLDRPVLRLDNRMSDAPGKLIWNARLETPRDFHCRLHKAFEG